jgi:hypothetical protein
LFYWVRNVLIITLIAVGIVVPAKAMETLYLEELSSHCIHYVENSGSKDGSFCLRYIQGFIDGAVAADGRVIVYLTLRSHYPLKIDLADTNS